MIGAFPMLVPTDGNDRNRNVAARDAAPVRGTYICNNHPEIHPDDRHCWHESTARRLDWQGGPSAGADADLAAWNRLGGRS